MAVPARSTTDVLRPIPPRRDHVPEHGAIFKRHAFAAAMRQLETSRSAREREVAAQFTKARNMAIAMNESSVHPTHELQTAATTRASWYYDHRPMVFGLAFLAGIAMWSS